MKNIYSKEIFTREIIKEEDYEPIPKEICPECKDLMLERENRFICLKCGIEISR